MFWFLSMGARVVEGSMGAYRRMKPGTSPLEKRFPIVGMAATPDGRGYWLVASDCGIFTYGLRLTCRWLMRTPSAAVCHRT
jgi:hypothetical protein